MKFLNGFSLASAALGALSLSFGLSLVACGSDSSSSKDDGNKTPDGIDQFESMDDLVHCTKSHFGEIAYVTEKDSIYECTSEGWVVADSAKVEEILSSSDSKSDSDGKSSGSKDNSGDSDEKSSSSITASAEDTAKVETVKVDSVTVLGLAEKGPFTKGTVVNVYGLDSALNKSKTSFKGAVNDDKGNYSVSKIKLSSQYVMVEVNGFFNNEVTGKVTSGTKTKLRALVDLSEGDTVKANVNVLTDLEYERAIALVKNDKYNVPAAKARATKEILAAFGVKADSVTATKISLSGENAATNGLLAASVAVIGNLSLSKFQARLGDVAESLAATGSISDTLRAEIADDLSLLDSNGAMVDIMKNIKALNAKATGVDSLLYAFWSDNYKLPACDAKAEETIAKNGNKLSSNYGAGYACTSNRWHKSTALDTELGLCVAKNEGKYETTKGGKYYTCKAGQWREITKEQYTLGACTEEIAKDAAKKYKSVDNKKYFVCKDLQWEEITADEYELKDCGADKNETVAAAKTSKVSYVCLDGAWRKATAQEEAFGYCSKVDSTKFKTLEKVSYACLEEGWTKVDDLTAELGFCTGKIPESKMFETKSGEFYSCVDDQWTTVDKVTAAIGSYCESGNDGDVEKISDGDVAGEYLCLDKEWTICDSKNNQKVYSDMGKVCENESWRKVETGEIETGEVCREQLDDNKVYEGFVCEKSSDAYGWREASEGEIVVGYVCAENNVNVLNGNYVCEYTKATSSYSWREATENEKIAGGICSKNSVAYEDWKWNNDKTEAVYCQFLQWRKTTSLEKKLKEACFESGRFNGDYVCDRDDGVGDWRLKNKYEIATGEYCEYSRAGFSEVVKGLYVCDDRHGKFEWRDADIGEKKRGVTCFDQRELMWSGYPTWSGNSTKLFAYSDDGKLYMCGIRDGVADWNTEYEPMTATFNTRLHKIVNIGSQWWMSENMKPADLSECNQFNGTTTDCRYGKTYETLTEAKAACPAPWRLPSDADWNKLFNFVDAYIFGVVYGRVEPDTIGTKLYAKRLYGGYYAANAFEEKGSSYVNYSYNLTGFSAMPTNYYYSGNSTYNYESVYWTSDGHYARFKNDAHTLKDILKPEVVNSMGGKYGVRCVRDVNFDSPTGL